MGRKPAGEQPLPRQPRSIKGLDPELWHRARVAALRQHKTIGQWHNEAIREKLEREGR